MYIFCKNGILFMIEDIRFYGDLEEIRTKMHSLLYVEINVFALAVLLLIYLNIRRNRTDVYLLEQRLFLMLILSNALILIFDSLMWLLDGTGGALMRELNQFVTVIYYSLNPAICMLWALYADYLIYRSEPHLKKIWLPLFIPAAAIVVLSLASVFGGMLFYIDANNVYHRGDLFLLMVAVCYFYLVYTLVKIIAMQNRIQKNDFLPILFFVFPPFIGGVFQVLFYGISLIWVCMTISILIVFINIQNGRVCTDYLTGLFNRRQLDNYLISLSQRNWKKGYLGGLMIDLNDFKMINDKYGHDTGDMVLKEMAQILENTFRKRDFIARYGGDEFTVLMELENESGLYKAVKRLQNNVMAFNEKSTEPFTISLSIGYDVYDSHSQMTVFGFIRHIDALMYRNKQENEKDDAGDSDDASSAQKMNGFVMGA